MEKELFEFLIAEGYHVYGLNYENESPEFEIDEGPQGPFRRPVPTREKVTIIIKRIGPPNTQTISGISRITKGRI